MVRCSILGCKSDGEKKLPELSFHSYPQDNNLRKKWIDATGRVNWNPKKFSKICSLHFMPNVIIKKKKLTWLLRNATPILKSHLKIVEPKNLDDEPIETKVDHTLHLESQVKQNKLNKPRVPSPYLTSDLPEVRQLILRVYRYLHEEYEQLKELTENSSDLTPLADILKRTATATGVSENIVTAILDEGEVTEDTNDCSDDSIAKQKLEYEADEDINQRKQEYSDDGPDDEQGLNDYILKTMKIELEEDWIVPTDIRSAKLGTTDPLYNTPSPEHNTHVTVKCELGYHLIDHQYTKCPSLAHLTSATLTTVKSEPEDDEMSECA